jgi:hypothetical protein
MVDPMIDEPIEGRVEGATDVAVDVVLRSEGHELGRARQRAGFWLQTDSGRVWVEPLGATLEGVREVVTRGTWSDLARRAAEAGIASVAIGPHVRVELATRALKPGTRVEVVGHRTTRPTSTGGGEYREAAGERVIEARVLRVGARDGAVRDPRSGIAAELALSVGALLVVLFALTRLRTVAWLEPWAWSGWCAVLAVGVVAVTERRMGFVHLTARGRFWDFVPQFAQVRTEAHSGGDESRTGTRLFAALFLANFVFGGLYVLGSLAPPDEAPTEDALSTLCAILGLVNHALAWLWIASRRTRSRADALRLAALLRPSPTWTVRGGEPREPIERCVEHSAKMLGTGRSSRVEHALHERWTDLRTGLSTVDGTVELSLEGAYVASHGELVAATPGTARREQWLFAPGPRWLVAHAGPPRGDVRVQGPESLLVFAADAPADLARQALRRRRASAVVLGLFPIIGASCSLLLHVLLNV